MIPLRDNIRSRKFPLVNISLIVVYFWVFFYQIRLLPEEAYRFVYAYGLVPQDFLNSLFLPFNGNQELGTLVMGTFAPLVTAIFLHGGWLHLLGNMLYLWIFGDNVEERLGSVRYLAVYLFMGIGGNLAHIIFNPHSTAPVIGASGAIAGVLGIYFLVFPRAKVLTLLPLGFFITFVHVPAVLFLALWFILQVFNALIAQNMAMGAEQVAWWAHVGGFLLGMTIGFLSRSKEKLR
ncbi:MAG: rhomboid family intramembrane serine protease [Dethiobacteria bacterium]